MTGPAVCRFYGCDATVSATVGIMPLCLLHQSYVLQLMDRGTCCTFEDGPAITSDGWQLIHSGELESEQLPARSATTAL